jgi:hypothetical protein
MDRQSVSSVDDQICCPEMTPISGPLLFVGVALARRRTTLSSATSLSRGETKPRRE